MVKPIEIELHLYGEEDEFARAAKAAGITEEAVVNKLAYALREVKVTILASPETGSYAVKEWLDLTRS